MTWLKNKLKNLQARPYAARLKILKIGVALVIIILFIIWAVTIRYRSRGGSPAEQNSKFAPIIESLKKLKEARP